MKKIRNYLSCHQYFYLLLLFIPLQIWFEHSELTLSPVYFTQTKLDERIPFIQEFVVPYLLWFIFVPYGVIYVGMNSKKDFYKLFLFLFGGIAVSNLAFIIFPNAQGLRPTISSDDPFSTLVRLIYAVDTPTDVCPSLHVLISIAINAALQHSQTFSESRFRKAAAHTLTILICLSTVFIKQHAVLDVFCAMIVSTFFYIPLYILPARRLKSRHLSNSGKNVVMIRTDEIRTRQEINKL